MPQKLTKVFKELNRLLRNRRSDAAKSNALFYDGEHWQGGKGFIGQKPEQSNENFTPIMNAIRDGFVSENVIAEVVNRHLENVLGREPLWRLLPENAAPEAEAEENAPANPVVADAEAALTVWWNEREILGVIQDATKTALLEGAAIVRPFVPRGLRDENGEIPAPNNLAEALDLLHFEVLPADRAGVFRDDDTMQPFGVFAYEREKQKFVELTYIDADGNTQLETIRGGNNENNDAIVETAEPLELGGRLFLYEMTREAIISEQIRSNQKSLNLSLTMMMRNINLAGSRERYFFNAQIPKKTTQIPDETRPEGYREVKENAPVAVGAGAANFIKGTNILDDRGKIIGVANPNVSITDPVSVETFEKTRDKMYGVILGQTGQRYALISGDAAASGRSRIEARKEFEGTLKNTKTKADPLGRWLLEVAVRFAAQLCGETAKFANLRADFNALVDTGAPEPTERAENRADVEAGLLSMETAMSRNQIEDTDSELSRIVEEQKKKAKQPESGDGGGKPPAPQPTN